MHQNNFCTQELGINPNVLGYKILIRAPKIPEKTSGGIYLPDDVKEDMAKLDPVGLVLKIGPCAFGQEPQIHFKCNVGDWIWYDTSARKKVIMPGKTVCYWITDDNLLGIVPKENVEKVLNGAS